ncbi:hypothetical protein [Alicyclobacillus sp. SO9]|uniref:hypothetical protein n=1 Tax=Alicyclobacillus sp. SO9 TaxID=2665646 RepID=UPI0018E85459|nr:hypothetical protein [Alicyclobacillus sp. SO9]QQE78295.1 hypothetical protein GI364_20830 [Alicyclobacillus sp. SO9]
MTNEISRFSQQLTSQNVVGVHNASKTTTDGTDISNTVNVSVTREKVTSSEP